MPKLTPTQKDILDDVLQRISGGLWELRGIALNLPGAAGTKVTEFTKQIAKAGIELREELGMPV